MATAIDPVESMPEAAPAAPARPHRMRHMPGLDGLRGMAILLGPLAYHFAPYWMPGGMLGVDLFFVVSSFLITSIALHEWDSTDRLDLGSYASRRVRRLLPALMVTFVVVAVITATVLDPSRIHSWTGGTAGALSYVANWREIFAGTDYFDAGQYSNPQPFRHVWSFAIEEQFYLFAPFFLLVCLRWLNRRWLLVLAVAGALASAVWMSVVFDPRDASSVSRAYYGTDTRAFALFLGVALAVVLRRWGPPRSSRGHLATQVAAGVALLAYVILIFNVDERTTWMFEWGGFLLVAVLSMVLVRAASLDHGWFQWLFRNRFLRWAGRLCFGLYLYHWIVLIVVDRDTDADQPGLNNLRDMVVAVVVTLVLAWASYRWIERPFIKGRWPGWRLTGALAAGAALTIGLLVYANVVRVPDVVASANGVPTVDLAPGAQGSACTAPEGSDPTRVLIVGDSAMVQIAQALSDWCAANPGQILLFSDAHLGCGTTRGGEKRYEEGDGSAGEVCATWADPADPAAVAGDVVSWVTAIEMWQPDVVMSMPSVWDSIDRRVPGLGDAWLKPGDPAYDGYLRSEYSEALDVLSARGATVAWIVMPHINRTSPYNNPERVDRINEIVVPLVEALPRHALVDYPGFLGPTGGERDRMIRDDGVHIRAEHLQTVADWLAPQLVDAGRAAVPSPR
jgi:peptidoglycan/LPS O-acetylase OafA/YrhL